jgi:hypothetical protein
MNESKTGFRRKCCLFKFYQFPIAYSQKQYVDAIILNLANILWFVEVHLD